MAEHDEQTIRISNLHFASTLMGQSVLEICWSDDPQILFSHVKILLSIIEKNFRNPDHWAEKQRAAEERARMQHQKRPRPVKIPPAFVHFDLEKGNKQMEETYDALLKLLKEDPDVAERLEEGSLQFLATVTDRDTYKLRLKV